MDETGPAAPPPVTVGARLAAARADAGLTLEDVAQRTRIPLRHLAAIEAGSGEGLPALTYAAGFVRSFAGAVGLVPNDVARDYRQELGALPPARQAAEPWDAADPARVPSWWFAIAALVIAIIVAGTYAVWRGDALFGHGDKSPAEIATETLPATAPGGAVPSQIGALPAPAVATAAAGAPVVLTAIEPVWLKVSDGDRRLFMGILDPGKSFAVPADAADPRLRTGRPQVLKVTVGGVERPPLGRPDQILRAVSLASATLGQEGAPGQVTTEGAHASTPLHRHESALPSSAATGGSSPSPTGAPAPTQRSSATPASTTPAATPPPGA